MENQIVSTNPTTGEQTVRTYQIKENGKAIECWVCSYTSHNENDVKYKYCGMCHDFHETPTGKIKKFIKAMLKQHKPMKERKK